MIQVLAARLGSRLAIFAVTTIATTVIPALIQDRPVLKWTWGKFGPVLETRLTDRITRRLSPTDGNPIQPIDPALDNQPVDTVPYIEPIYPEPRSSTLLNPSDYCPQHWWSAGPVRFLAALPFRLFRG